MFGKFLFYFLFMELAMLTLGYSTGAPIQACGTMTAEHNQTEQTVPAPYDIVLSDRSIKRGETIVVTISGKTEDDTIKGFLSQARRVSDNKLVGTFVIDEHDTFVQPLNCFNITASSATHKKMDPINSFNLTWAAPQDLTEEVIIYTTIVKDMRTAWDKVPSEKFHVV